MDNVEFDNRKSFPLNITVRLKPIINDIEDENEVSFPHYRYIEGQYRRNGGNLGVRSID